MRQKNLPGTRKKRLRDKRDARRRARVFMGTCSQCGDKGVKVTLFKTAQICISKCVPAAVEHLSGTISTPGGPVIKAE